jgi:Zn-dependent peptidase ImmA (M78 family)
MRRRRAPFPRVVLAATEVLALRGIATPEELVAGLEDIAADLGVMVRRAAIGNAEGRLVRSGWRGVITIDESAYLSEKWRFVLAHELGHFLLHVMRQELLCFPKANATREDRSRSFLDEEGASGFGVELTQPGKMVRPRYDFGASPMQRARTIASVFHVSPVTAALRVLDFTDEPCAVVYAERGVVKWCTATNAFRVNVANGSRVPHGARVVDASAWGRPSGGVTEVRADGVELAPFEASVGMVWHREAGRDEQQREGMRVSG